MQRQYFTFQNLKLSYLEINPQAERKVLVAHANGYAAGCYAYIMEHLAADYHVCALDFSGHGESEPNFTFTGWGVFCQQIEAFIAHKDWQSCTAIGHSLGGGTILRTAQMQPRLFERIIAFDPVVLGFLSVAYVKFFKNPMARTALSRRAHFKDKVQALKIFLRHPANRSWQEEGVRAYVEYCIGTDTSSGEAYLKCDPRVESRIFSHAEFGHLFKLGRITSKCHLILPEKSNVCPQWVVGRITANNPTSSIERVAGSGHLLPFENRDLTISLIDRYLAPKVLSP